MVTLQIKATSSYDFKLSRREVHVWCASLLQPAHVDEQLYGLLSRDEKVRAERYYFTHLQQSFVVSRGVLRILLAHCTDLQPEQLAFIYLHAGKPELSEKHDPKVFFNLSHSNELALYAFSCTRNVGIDIEYIRPVDDPSLIAERNFSTHETDELKKLSPVKVLDGFFNCWTRKKAYIKAIGDGISFPL
jgi:4'-phosphopantetheinyl transferase